MKRLIQIGCWIAAAAAGTALMACAPMPTDPAQPTGPDGLFLDRAFAPPSVPVDARQVFALSPAMRAYLVEHVNGEVQAHGLQRGLINALYSNQQLALAYDGEYTRNAAEAFDARAGNCLSLAIMTGAFAKELGLAVRFRSVYIDDSWGRDGDLVQYVGHVNISIGRQVPKAYGFDNGPDWWTVDFIPPEDIKRQRADPITEQRIVAMYLNNKAAEALAHGRTDDAYWWVRSAIVADPAFVDLYNTLGLVYLRHDQPQLAEAALRATLARRSEHPQAMANLAVVLRRQGREAEAAALENRLVALRAVSPFAAFQRAREAIDAGNYAQARDLLEQALRKANDYHEFHFWLAVAYLRLGERDRAITHLRLAEENSVTRQQQSAYAAKLQRLKAGGAGGG